MTSSSRHELGRTWGAIRSIGMPPRGRLMLEGDAGALKGIRTHSYPRARSASSRPVTPIDDFVDIARLKARTLHRQPRDARQQGLRAFSGRRFPVNVAAIASRISSERVRPSARATSSASFRRGSGTVMFTIREGMAATSCMRSIYTMYGTSRGGDLPGDARFHRQDVLRPQTRFARQRSGSAARKAGFAIVGTAWRGSSAKETS